MSNVTVEYQLTDAAIRAELIATGNQPNPRQHATIDLVALSPEQRTAFADYGFSVEIRTYYDDGGNYQPLTSRWLPLDAAPTADEVIAHIARMTREQAVALATIHARQLENAETKIAEYITKAENALEQRYHGAWLEDFTEAIYKECPDLARYKTLRRQYLELAPVFKEEYEARQKAAQDAKDAEAEAKRQARLMWAREHGSDRLRRGMEAGHSCDRLYLIEKCAIEYPGCTLDYEKEAETKDRACPTVTELDALDAMLEEHPTGCTVTIVWLTCEPSDTKREPYDSDFEPCAALEIDDEDYPRMIYKIL